MRFKRAPAQILGSKLFHRRDVNSRLTIDRAVDRGEFLARLWTLFGPPTRRDGGFEYFVRDLETNLDFTAYAAARGPCYGGEAEQRFELRRVIEAFEELLEQTQPVDCAIDYSADREYGGGKWVVGYKDGRSFDVPDRRSPSRGSIPVERRSQRRQ
jgi:hypothetical protein